MTYCPRCFSEKLVKDGIIKGKQRHLCKDCGYRHTVKERGATKKEKRLALELYLEGLGFRSIGRILKFSHVAVYNWIKEFGEKAEEIRSSESIEVVEIDEMHSYIASKKTPAGSGYLLIDMGKDSSTVLLATEALQRE